MTNDYNPGDVVIYLPTDNTIDERYKHPLLVTTVEEDYIHTVNYQGHEQLYISLKDVVPAVSVAMALKSRPKQQIKDLTKTMIKCGNIIAEQREKYNRLKMVYNATMKDREVLIEEIGKAWEVYEDDFGTSRVEIKEQLENETYHHRKAWLKQYLRTLDEYE